MVPLRLVIAAQTSEGRPDSLDLPEPWEGLPTPKRLAEIDNCFAAEIADLSAELDFASGTVLYLKPLAAPQSLAIGSKVVVRFLRGARNTSPPTNEALYGILDRAATGDLVLLTRSRDRRLPASLVIQRDPLSQRGISEQTLAMIPRESEIDYQPRSTDEAEIVGVVLYALGPV